MKIAIATLNGTTVTAHFGRTKAFVVADVDDGVETARELRDVEPNGDTDPHGSGHKCRPDALIGTIADCAVVIAGGMGLPIQNRLEQAGIQVLVVDTRSIDEVIEQYRGGSLSHDSERVHAHGGCDSH